MTKYIIVEFQVITTVPLRTNERTNKRKTLTKGHLLRADQKSRKKNKQTNKQTKRKLIILWYIGLLNIQSNDFPLK